MVNFSRIHSKADLIGSLNPKAWDAVNPHIPFVFSNAHVDLMVADVVKSVAVAITNKALSREVMDISKSMAKQASTALAASWEPGDELCPPWPWPFPHPRSWVENLGFEPDPIPWKPVLAAELVELAHILIRLSGQTTSKESNVALKGVATKLVGVAATSIVSEFENSKNVPRKSFTARKLASKTKKS
ncbi:MAG: hypothetical protein DID92_2727744060 [Candidatus Nitrotoga sp. SPKER]|nr:MAG: hypothetical protein DID92_2727744060 [Candidatus Nitrotoga sp. SPKER]